MKKWPKCFVRMYHAWPDRHDAGRIANEEDEFLPKKFLVNFSVTELFGDRRKLMRRMRIQGPWISRVLEVTKTRANQFKPIPCSLTALLVCNSALSLSLFTNFGGSPKCMTFCLGSRKVFTIKLKMMQEDARSCWDHRRPQVTALEMNLIQNIFCFSDHRSVARAAGSRIFWLAELDSIALQSTRQAGPGTVCAEIFGSLPNAAAQSYDWTARSWGHMKCFNLLSISKLSTIRINWTALNLVAVL